MSGLPTTVFATFSRDGEVVRTADLRLELVGCAVYLRGGPTAMRSFHAAAWHGGDTWCACAGGMGWDRCDVTGMERALRELGVIR